MKTMLVIFYVLIGFSSFATGQSYEIQTGFDFGDGTKPVSSKGIGNLNTVTFQAPTQTEFGPFGFGTFTYQTMDLSNTWSGNLTINTPGILSLFNEGDTWVNVVPGKYYTFNLPSEPLNDNTNKAAILETNNEPVSILSVSRDKETPEAFQDVVVSVTLSAPKGADETVYLIWTYDNWSSIFGYEVAMEGETGTATINPSSAGNTIQYYVITTSAGDPFALWANLEDIHLLTLNYNNNSGSNYSYLVVDTTPPAQISSFLLNTYNNYATISLTWAPVTASDFDGYEIFYNTTGFPVTESDIKFDKSTTIALAEKATSQLFLDSLQWETSYYFAIRAIDKNGNKGTFANASTGIGSEPFIVIDGVFDGTNKWGEPITVGNGTPGAFGANAKRMYTTHDNDFAYFGILCNIQQWMKWSVIINTKLGGGYQDVQGANIFFDHQDQPDFCIRGENTENLFFCTWMEEQQQWIIDFDSMQNGVDFAIGYDEFGNTFIEFRISQSWLGSAMISDVEFYISGPGFATGAFDCLPNDENSDTFSMLRNYATVETLPVEFSSFSGKTAQNGVILTWKTASEINNYGFEIQKSENKNSAWTEIGFVAGFGTSTESNTYNFTDSDNKKNGGFYRLKQIDLDGKFQFSETIEVTPEKIVSFSLDGNFPNPFNPSTIINYNLPNSGKVGITIFNMLGQKVLTTGLNGESGRNQFSFQANGLTSGIYYYKLTFEGSSITGKMTLLK